MAPKVVPFRDGLVRPWSLAFLSDGSMLVTERPGRLRHVSADGATLSAPIAGVPADVFASSLKEDPPLQAGLFDVVLDPAFATNRRIYLSYVQRNSDSDSNGVVVWRGELTPDLRSLVNGRVIYTESPRIGGERNYGGKLLFDRGGYLLVTLGDRFEPDTRDQAQQPGSGLGKIVRLTTDGAPAPGNPVVSGGTPGLWSLGHRNPQGLAIHPVTGQLWESEHGPQGGDEINLVLPGGNYGWPRVSYGCEYETPIENCKPIGGGTSSGDQKAPLTWWGPPSIAPGGIAFYTGKGFPEWQGSLFVAALADKALWRLTLNGSTVLKRERLLDVGRRLRDVRQGPDGWLYLLTDEDAGQILRVQR
ncbi:PQQ-dependent sugar dehydrogenase [Azohydromonas caseinilytica]|uniref:PQQ-dependent sugar dehydrogenase n=1 Tax=Azohydromonas caseinilytica TaxID=2728836 RepID=UPI0028738CFD|nr:PQQ-dependent sugar dehydrogenase [Azohydromonas caseinilytica]